MGNRTEREGIAIRFHEAKGAGVLIRLGRGGVVQGGVRILGGYTIDVTDPLVPHDLTIDVAARGGRLVADRLQVTRREGGPDPTVSTMRRLALDTYLARSLAEMPATALWQPGQVEGRAALVPASGEQQRDAARRQAPATLAEVADAYQRAKDSDEWAHRPVEGVAHFLHYGRQRASVLVGKARDAGLIDGKQTSKAKGATKRPGAAKRKART